MQTQRGLTLTIILRVEFAEASTSLPFETKSGGTGVRLPPLAQTESGEFCYGHGSVLRKRDLS